MSNLNIPRVSSPTSEYSDRFIPIQFQGFSEIDMTPPSRGQSEIYQDIPLINDVAVVGQASQIATNNASAYLEAAFDQILERVGALENILIKSVATPLEDVQAIPQQRQQSILEIPKIDFADKIIQQHPVQQDTLIKQVSLEQPLQPIEQKQIEQIYQVSIKSDVLQFSPTIEDKRFDENKSIAQSYQLPEVAKDTVYFQNVTIPETQLNFAEVGAKQPENYFTQQTEYVQFGETQTINNIIGDAGFNGEAVTPKQNTEQVIMQDVAKTVLDPSPLIVAQQPTQLINTTEEIRNQDNSSRINISFVPDLGASDQVDIFADESPDIPTPPPGHQRMGLESLDSATQDEVYREVEWRREIQDRLGWNGQVYFEGNLIEDYGAALNWPLNIGGEYIEVAVDGSSVNWASAVSNPDYTEYFYYKVAESVQSGGFRPSNSHAGGVHIWPELPEAVDGELDWYNVESRYVLTRRVDANDGATERYCNEWYPMAPVPKAPDENYELISNSNEDGDHGWADAIPLGGDTIHRENVSENLARMVLSKKVGVSSARSEKYENEWHPLFGVPSPSTAGQDGPLVTSDSLYFWEPGWQGDIDVVTDVVVEDSQIVFKTMRLPFRYGIISYDDPPQETDDIIIPITDCT